MTNNELNEWAQKVADALEGQCVVGIEGMCEQLGAPEGIANDDRFLALIDERVFCCEGYGWYCSTDELNNDTGEELCDDCDDE